MKTIFLFKIIFVSMSFLSMAQSAEESAKLPKYDNAEPTMSSVQGVYPAWTRLCLVHTIKNRFYLKNNRKITLKFKEI